MATNRFTIHQPNIEGMFTHQGSSFSPSLTEAQRVATGADDSQRALPGGLTGLTAADLYQVQIDSLNLPETYKFDSSSIVQTSIKHVDAATTLLHRHWDLFETTRSRLDDDTDSDSLHQRLLAFVEKWGGDADVKELLSGRYYTVNDNGAIEIIKRPTGTQSDPQVRRRTFLKLGENDNDSSALFKLSRVLMNDYHNVSGQRAALQRLKRRKLVSLKESAKAIADLEREIDSARVTFENREKDRSAADGDYALVRGLLDEQLQAVDDAFVERHRLLSDPVGLCYVRVHDQPVSLAFHQTPLLAQPVNGGLPVSCSDGAELPARLQPFLELLSEQPMAAWQALRGEWRRLPHEWLQRPPQPVLSVIEPKIRALPVVFHGLINNLPVPVRVPKLDQRLSQADKGRQLAARLSLEQLAGSARSRLRRKARTLQDDLGAALACLLQQLQALPASIRFRWSRLAEDDRLDTRSPNRWPGFDSVQQQTAGLVLRDTIDWLYAQLSADAPSDAHTAMRSAVRACLLQAVNDDPADLLQGDVVEFPGIWQAGAVFTANLNQIPSLSARLRVYDDRRRLIGEAKVVDSREQQAQVEVVQTYAVTPTAFTAWTLVGSNR